MTSQRTGDRARSRLAALNPLFSGCYIPAGFLKMTKSLMMPRTRNSHTMRTTSKKYKEAEAILPDDLKPIFNRFVEEYEFLTKTHFGRGYVAYMVLADLVLAGWRPSAERLPESRLSSAFPNTLDQVVADDVRSLVENKIREGDRLEYKESLPKPNDDERIKFLCTVASLANTLGGDIVIGVGELRDGTRKTGELFIKGLKEADFDFDRERNRLTEMVLKGIDPRIGRIEFKLVDGLPEGPVIVVRVPRSINNPHLVTFNEFNRFFARHSGGRYAMNVREIRQAFLASELMPERIRSFRDQRVTSIINGDLPVPLTAQAKIVMHVIPFSAVDERNRFDISAAFELRNEMRTIGDTIKSSRHNLDGLVVFGGQSGTNPAYESYIQVFRSGMLEVVNSSILEGNASNLIPSGVLRAGDSSLVRLDIAAASETRRGTTLGTDARTDRRQRNDDGPRPSLDGA